MQIIEIQQLQNLLDVAFSYVKNNVINLRSKGLTWGKLTEITGLDSTRLQRIVNGRLGEMSSRFLVRACSGLNQYLASNFIKNYRQKKARGNGVERSGN